jgi:hypothetical protein
MSVAAAPAGPRGKKLSEHALRYVARAGLLPELSAQTYSSFYTALREAILNAIDAGATRIDLDFSGVSTGADLVISDDGRGMSFAEFRDYFMSLGGSPKFGDAGTFGRIGIGSLALLHYGVSATVETKRAASRDWVVARIEHPWQMNSAERLNDLEDLSAGTAVVNAYEGDQEEHFTRLRLHDVSDDVKQVASDPSSFFALLAVLRRILPLRWPQCRLVDAIYDVDRDVAQRLRQHADDWAIDVFVHSDWEKDIELTRRFYGSDGAEVERWSGLPRVLAKRLRVSDSGGSRELVVLGFLLHQLNVLPSWSGLTARVQNVAVENGTFFDVNADAGFRKYITGEIYILGEVNSERLINIDRSSFNRECPDYEAVQRYMAREIHDFKAQAVQASQRRKVTARKTLTRWIESIDSVSRVTELATSLIASNRLPSSNNGRIRGSAVATLEQQLSEVQTTVRSVETVGRAEPFALTLAEGSTEIVAALPSRFIRPRVKFHRSEYEIVFLAGTGVGPPVVIRNRPREIVFDVRHPAHSAEGRPKYHLSLALELAHLIAESQHASLYEMMLAFVEAI